MRPLIALAPAILLASLTLPALAGEISVLGEGTVTAAPDTATINSGVTTQAATAREALDANSAAMDELIATLKEAGIAERDIQTSNFSVSPNYVYSDARDENGYSLPPRIDGYQVSNSVTVKVRDLEQLGAILDRSVTVGANTINGIGFSVADPSSLLDDARRQAVRDARAKAELYAEAAGATLGELEKISESQNVGGPQPYAMAMRADAQSVPVAAGELSFSVSVNVAWEIRDSRD